MREKIEIGSITDFRIIEKHEDDNSHQVVIDRLLDMHQNDINKIESAVESALKPTEEACHRHHSSILIGLENSYLMKENNIIQRLNQSHDQQLEALKAQFAQELLEHVSSYKQREVNLKLDFDNELKTKLQAAKLIEQQEAEKALCAAIRACDDGWKAQIEGQAEAHAETLRKLEERHRSVVQERIDSIIETTKTQYLQREADLKGEYSIALENAVDKERKMHATELQSLQSKYELILHESDLKLEVYGENQYQKGLCENESTYRSNVRPHPTFASFIIASPSLKTLKYLILFLI